jgi:NAD-dependent SIR2 family protein deacetylase
VLINNQETPLDDIADLVIRESIGATLSAVLQHLDTTTEQAAWQPLRP